MSPKSHCLSRYSNFLLYKDYQVNRYNLIQMAVKIKVLFFVDDSLANLICVNHCCHCLVVWIHSNF